METADAGIVVSLIVARAANGAIGMQGKLPWRQKTDMAHFRAVTMGKPIVMGRKTWESFKKGALPGRDNIVLTRAWDFEAKDAWLFASLGPALACARSLAYARGVDEICVIGGEEIYRLALPLAQRIHLTDIEADVAGDAFFPDLDPVDWGQVSETVAPAGAADDHPMRFRVLERL